MLEFRACRECGESHALQRSGAMSIHTNASGERCSEIQHPRRESIRPKPVDGPRSQSPRESERSEVDEAFEYIHEQRHSRRDPETKPLDRRIYATKGMSTVRGGAPTLGRDR